MTDSAALPPDDENHIIAERREKLRQWREAGGAYPNDFHRTHYAGEITAQHTATPAETLDAQPEHVQLAGRIMLKRVMGKASFATIQDMSGRIQLYVTNDGVGEDVHGGFKHWDLGDIVGCSGTLFRTRTGELTVKCDGIRLLSKALRALPEKFHGLADQETKYRFRDLDLITNESSRNTFIARSRMMSALRAEMTRQGFLEVETPMMHPIPGGAAAKPFRTHHNALDMELFLRIAPELYLKRLVVGGFENVFEVNRNFRFEGFSPRHNPEFTMLEFYQAYADYRQLMDFTEYLLRHCAEQALGATKFMYQGRELDLGQPFHRLTIVEAIQKYNPQYSDADLADEAFVTKAINTHGESVKPGGMGSLQLQLFEACAESQLWEPTFIIDYPAEVSPLARRSDTQPDITERFELFIVGREIANGFSELNDPEDQAARFHDQVKAKDAGDEEAMYFDADYIRALEHGLPPTGGCGIGIDRLVMLLTDSANIRDVILFPQMRRE